MKKGHIVYIGNVLSKHGYTPTNIETLGPLLEKEGYKIVYASSKRNPAVRLLDMVAVIFKNRKSAALVLIDTYSTSAFYFALLCCIVAKYCKLKYAPILHGGNLDVRIKQNPRLANIIFANAYSNIVISGYFEAIMKRLKYPTTRISNNIDLNRYTFKKRTHLRPKILWVRSFDKIYNPELAIRLLQNIRLTYPEAILAMVGPDKDGSMESCKELAIQLKVDKYVEFTGRLAKDAWLSKSVDFDIFINTTNVDNLPVSVIEAMALGLPVVSTNVGGVPYLIEDRRNGILIEKNNLPAMTNAILELLENADLAATLSAGGRHTAAEFDWEFVKLKWRSFLNPILEKQ
jgi:L-malate glycosyltransferase